MQNEKRDRLIELINNKQDYGATLKVSQMDERSTRTNYIQNSIIADYLIENGVILPPCKVGDTVYKVVNDKRVKRPYECKVIGFWFSEDENCNNAHLVRYVNGVFDSSFSVPFTDFGKTVFLSREEAEEKLEEMKNG